MVEQMIDSADELLLELPYMRRLQRRAREEARAEALVEGRAEGQDTGRAEGVRLGEQKGILDGLRQAVLDILVLRFNPPTKTYFQCQQRLEEYAEQKTLQRLLAVAVQSEDIAAFILQLEEMPTNGHP